MSNVLFVHDFSFLRNADGRIFYAVGLPESYFDRFFNAGYTKVDILSRGQVVTDAQALGSGCMAGENTDIAITLSSSGKYLSIFNPTFFRQTIKKLRSADLVVTSMPSILGIYVLLVNLFVKAHYVADVAGDDTMFATKRGGFVVTWFLQTFMKTFVRNAAGASYVTHALRKKFSNSGSVIVCSNVNLAGFSDRPAARVPLYDKDTVAIGYVGGLTKRKGLAPLFDALKLLKDDGFENLSLNMVGGHADDDWAAYIADLGLQDNVVFHGVCPPEQVYSLQQTFDVYVQPSFSEGLPRATIEAMACATPVVATQLPGFREILPEDCLVPTGQADQLAARIKTLLTDVDDWNTQSARNFERAQDFNAATLNDRRTTFYRTLREALT